MIRRFDVPLGMGHQAKQSPAGVANASDIGLCAIGVVGEWEDVVSGGPIGKGVSQGQSSGSRRGAASRGVNRHKFSFRMCHRKINAIDVAQKHTWSFVIRVASEINPPILESTMVIPSQSSRGWVRETRREDSHPHENLETIANPQDQPILIAKITDQTPQMMLDPAGQNSPCGDIVAVTESAGKTEDLKPLPKCWILDQAIDMDSFCNPPRAIKSGCGFFVTIGPGGAKNEDSRGSNHGSGPKGIGEGRSRKPSSQ